MKRAKSMTHTAARSRMVPAAFRSHQASNFESFQGNRSDGGLTRDIWGSRNRQTARQ